MLGQISNLFHFAGLAGASAVLMAGYGYHVLPTVDKKLDFVYLIGNLIHFIHSVALLAIPSTSSPEMSFWLVSVGMSIFCICCYYHAIFKDNSLVKLTPIGAILLIVGWMSIAIRG